MLQTGEDLGLPKKNLSEEKTLEVEEWFLDVTEDPDDEPDPPPPRPARQTNLWRDDLSMTKIYKYLTSN